MRSKAYASNSCLPPIACGQREGWNGRELDPKCRAWASSPY